jgi:hypothetical protein
VILLTHEVAIQDDSHLKSKIIELVHNNHSSISLIAEYLEADPEQVKHLILEALKEGRITGRLSEDELRFYRSDVKMPDPSSMVEEDESARSSLLIPKAILFGGIALFVAGQIVIRMASEGTATYNMSTALVFGGLFTIIGGLYAFTRFG